MPNNTARVTVEHDCDICTSLKRHPSSPRDLEVKKAAYDGKTFDGPWAWMCDEHFESHGVGLGVGRGQRLILVKGV